MRITDLNRLKRPIVRLVGEDGNAFSILGRVSKACKRAGWSDEQRNTLLNEMQSRDYNYLLCTAMEFCDEEQTQEQYDEEEGNVA